LNHCIDGDIKNPRFFSEKMGGGLQGKVDENKMA